MKLVLFGATGNVGQRVAAEALRRGHEVIGVVRDPGAVEPPDPRVRLVKGDATNAESVADVARGAEAVVSAISPRPNARGLPAPSLSANSRALIAGLRKAGVKRVLYVGLLRRRRRGPLDADPEPGEDVQDQLAVTEPADHIDDPIDTVEPYAVDDDAGTCTPVEPEPMAVLDEMEHPRHVGQRFGVAY